ncbi:MAG: 5,6-dimethylbenzimidazole synthase [Pseudomonadota bacterium]
MSQSEFEVLAELMARRRDVRRFRTDDVDETLLDEVFELVELSPSVGNSQPWRWVSVADTALRHDIQDIFAASNQRARAAVPTEKRDLYDSLKLAGLKEAPIQFAVFCDCETQQGDGLGRQTMFETLHYSVVCAIMTFWLAAKSKGLGVGWVSILDRDALSKALNVPGSWEFISYLCVGYPQEDHYDPELERFGWQDRVWKKENILKR